jgi:2-polyprenyl-3-methyl-5-hydroxy-6-metoxy-1,4-benzoquinol methylase
MTRLSTFYDRYHQKNSRFRKLIRPTNFTYFYILRLLTLAGLQELRHLKILDIGCGVGTMSLYAASLGAAVVGVDISPRAIDIARAAKEIMGFQKVSFKQGEVQQLKQVFDVVFCFEVLEHVAAEQQFLKQIHDRMKVDGILLLSTPSSDNWLFRQGYYHRFDAEVGHLRRYTPVRLKKVLKAAGFEIILIREVEGPLRNLLFTSKCNFLIKLIRGPLVIPFHVLDRVSGKLLGYTDIQVVAQKKS